MSSRPVIVMSCLVAVCTFAARAPAAEPSNDEQLMLELVNRMRWDPAVELHILANISTGEGATWGSPKSKNPSVAQALNYFNVDANALATQWAGLAPRVAPLAWNDALHNAAAGHNALMIQHQEQSHQLPGEPALDQRANNAGYTGWTNLAENVYAYSDSVFFGHAGFAIDWGPGPGGIQNPPGHRDNIMNGDLREVGVAITRENNPQTAVGPLVITQDFGRREGNAFVTGVVYDDTLQEGDYFYTPGEGLVGVDVRAFAAGTLRGETTTFASGGYSLELPAGTYDITLSGAGLGDRVITYRSIRFASKNIKLDNLSSFIADSGGAWTSASNWSAGVPNGSGTLAVLGRSIAGRPNGPQSINVTAPATVGQVYFDAANPVTVTGNAVLTFAGGGTATASIDVLPVPGGAVHTISAPLRFTGPVARDGIGTLVINGPQQHDAGSSLLVGAGRTDFATNAGVRDGRTLSMAVRSADASVNFLASQDLKRLDVTDRARVALSPGGGKLLLTEDLLVSRSRLDLTDNAALIDYSDPAGRAFTDARAAIRSAYAGGNWSGTGISSSSAATNSRTAVGYAQSTDLFDFRLDRIYTFFDRVVDETAVLIRYTREGDADLDGAVTFQDFLRFRENLSSAGDWSDGDFDYDGSVTVRDYALLRRNLGTSVGGPAAFVTAAELGALAAFEAAVVPEPSGGLALLLLAGAGLTGRRRRHNAAHETR
jgi:uncharacterized protein YkwD